MFFLLLAALPAGSYFYLHRSLVSQYEALSEAVHQEAREVRLACTQALRPGNPALCRASVAELTWSKGAAAG